MKADSTLVIVWWLWLVPALGVLLLPVEFAVAVCVRGLDSVQSSGIRGGGSAFFDLSAVLVLLSFPPLLILSPIYALLFWNRRRRGAPLSRRFWVPLYGSVLLIVALALVALTMLAGARRRDATPSPQIGELALARPAQPRPGTLGERRT